MPKAKFRPSLSTVAFRLEQIKRQQAKRRRKFGASCSCVIIVNNINKGKYRYNDTGHNFGDSCDIF
jgi:hypothetical protein